MSTFGHDPFPDRQNPYAAPESLAIAGEIDTRPAAILRREYLSHEASVQSIGLLYLLGCLACIIIGGVLSFLGISNSRSGELIGVGFFLLFAGVLQGFVGFGLRQLRGWTRIPVGILSGIGLIGFPIGTLINGYILYLIFSRRGRMVFSDEYRKVIEQTPEIKYRTSMIVWVFLILLLVLLALGAAAAILRDPFVFSHIDSRGQHSLTV